MDIKNFKRLISSIKEAKEIIKNQKKASRKFLIEEPNSKEIKSKKS
jgi:hypothetical protein